MFIKICSILFSILTFARAHYVVPWEKSTEIEDYTQNLQLLDVNGIVKILNDMMTHFKQEEAYRDYKELGLTLKEIWNKYGSTKLASEKERSFYDLISRKIEAIYSENQDDEQQFLREQL